MINSANKLVIVGGGSAAYLTAAFLSAKLPNAKIILIVPKASMPIGVGEATLLGFINFLVECGIENLDDFIDGIDGTVKNGILFKNWRADKENIWHPFMNISQDMFAALRKQGWNYTKILHNLPDYNEAVLNNSPTQNIGLHLNASKLIFELHKVVENRNNVRIIRDKVTSASCTTSGHIEYLTTETSGKVFGDLFIDSTGFNGIAKLLPQHLGASFKDCSEFLTCNAAVAVPLDYELSQKQYHPYTKATALPCGWSWETPLHSRMGYGIVYNSDCNTKQEIEDIIQKSFGSAMLANFNHINFRPGYVTNQWRHNLVSIGLSSGFVEPLESSGIAMFCDAADLIYRLIKLGFYNSETAVPLYNSVMNDKYEETITFVGGHYNVSPYSSDFWKLANTKVHTNYLSRMKEKYYSSKALTEYYNIDHSIFSPHSWLILFEGFEYDR